MRQPSASSVKVRSLGATYRIERRSEPFAASLPKSEVNCTRTPEAAKGESSASVIWSCGVRGEGFASSSGTPKKPLRMRTLNLPGRVTFRLSLWNSRRPVLASKVDSSG